MVMVITLKDGTVVEVFDTHGTARKRIEEARCSLRSTG